MADSLGKLISFIMATLSIVLIVLIMLTRMDGIVDTYITNKATSFIDTCRTTGKIDPDVYNTFATGVYELGNYSIELSHGKKIGLWDGQEARMEHNEAYTEQILSYMYPENEAEEKEYQMESGDVITITIRKEGNGLAGGLMEFLIGGTPGPTILVNYSGVVGTNGE